MTNYSNLTNMLFYSNKSLKMVDIWGLLEYNLHIHFKCILYYVAHFKCACICKANVSSYYYGGEGQGSIYYFSTLTDCKLLFKLTFDNFILLHFIYTKLHTPRSNRHIKIRSLNHKSNPVILIKNTNFSHLFFARSFLVLNLKRGE